MINLGQGEILYQSNNSISAIFEIVKCDAQSCIVFIGELLLICFSFEGYLIWKNNYTDTILNWVVYDKEILIAFENGWVLRCGLWHLEYLRKLYECNKMFSRYLDEI